MRITPTELAARLRASEELAVLDVRDHEDFLRERLLLSTGIAFDRLDVEVGRLLPRTSVPVVVIGDGAELEELAVRRLAGSGYTDLAVLAGGIGAWKAHGLPIYEDANVASKMFGELVEHAYRTPNIPPRELFDALGSRDRDSIVLLDCRPEVEHRYAHIPGALHVPGGDMFSAVRDLAPSADQHVVVHCGGRTRGIIGAQGLIAIGAPNRVSVLTDGVFGWHLADLPLERGLNPPRVDGSEAAFEWAQSAARELAVRAGITLMDAAAFERWRARSHERTLFCFDLRPRTAAAAPAAPHRAPRVAAGQLIQATDEYIGVRNSRVVLIDADLARAVVTAAWLRQMGWREVAVLPAAAARELSPAEDRPDPSTHSPSVECEAVHAQLARGALRVFDVSTSHHYVSGHIPGAGFVTRRQLVEGAANLVPGPAPVVIACEDGRVAAATAGELAPRLEAEVAYLRGGVRAWRSARLPLEIGTGRILAPTSWLNQDLVRAVGERSSLLREYVDWELERYFDPRRENRVEDAMQDYLDWEIALHARWARDRGMPFDPLGETRPARRGQ